jgi:hypothetical protein
VPYSKCEPPPTFTISIYSPIFFHLFFHFMHSRCFLCQAKRRN